MTKWQTDILKVFKRRCILYMPHQMKSLMRMILQQNSLTLNIAYNAFEIQ